MNENGQLIIKDEIFRVMDNLVKVTQLDFSKIQDVDLEWRAGEDEEVVIKNIMGKGFEVKDITNEQYQSVGQFLQDYGFEIDLNNAADGPTGSLSGYKKNGVVCLVVGSWEISEPNKKKVEIQCGLLENEIETQNLETKTGDGFSIVLDTNPTTGYEWQLDFDKDFIELVDRNYAIAPESEGLVGAGGQETFDFKALKVGESEITFSYLRSWETSVPPIEKIIYKITIE